MDAGSSGSGGIVGAVEAGGTGGVPLDGGSDAATGGTTSATGGTTSVAVDARPATYKVDGVAQKGPFGNGTNIMIAECDDSMIPTGRTFTTSIVDNTGAFSLPNVQLFGKYVRLTADGFYFDEVANQLSVSSIALNALADVTNQSTINVNLLTHLERPRLEYLVANGASFTSAKVQAQTEVLAIFGFTLSSAAASESLDIASGTDDDAILLAVSAILLGHQTPGELTELLSNIATDIRTDGVLNSTELGSALMNSAVLLDVAAIRSNLTHRYSMMGASATIGPFEKYVKAFVDSAKYSFTDVITYPDTGAFGRNFLASSVTEYDAGPKLAVEYMSLRADLPRGSSLKVVLKAQGGASWGIGDNLGTATCWTVGSFDSDKQQQEFNIASSANTPPCDLKFAMMPPGYNSRDMSPIESCVTVDYYENFEIVGTSAPTKSKSFCGDPPWMDAGVGPDVGTVQLPSDSSTDSFSAGDAGMPLDAPAVPDADESSGTDLAAPLD
jgi:hypothetical protein